MGKHRHKKVPPAAVEPSTAKLPRTGTHTDSQQLFPSWRLGRLECVDDFGAWHNLTKEKIHEIRTKLSSFERMTWHEILVRGKKQNHHVPVDNLVPAARRRLLELRIDDTDELLSLRLSGSERIYGIRQEGVLQLLWWDPEHKIYPVEKKGT